MEKSPNIKLTLTPMSQSSKRFVDFRNELASDDPNSNMMLIDKEIGEIKKSISKEVEGMAGKKVDKAQGVENAGKVLGIDPQGNVAVMKAITPETGASWGELKGGSDTVAAMKVSTLANEENTALPATAYDIAVKNGFVGSEVEWLESLHGRTPVRGIDYWTAEDKQEIINEVLRLIAEQK